jgi:hypothetical protein
LIFFNQLIKVGVDLLAPLLPLILLPNLKNNAEDEQRQQHGPSLEQQDNQKRDWEDENEKAIGTAIDYFSGHVPALRIYLTANHLNNCKDWVVPSQAFLPDSNKFPYDFPPVFSH